MQFESAYPLVPLKQLVSFINGDRSSNYPTARDYVPAGVPFISATDVGDGRIELGSVKRISRAAFERLRSGRVQRNDVLLCIRGSLGKLGVVSDIDEGAIASSLVILRSPHRFVLQYLRYVLSGAAGVALLSSLDNGSVQGNISVASLKELAIPSPPSTTVEAIASLMAQLDGRMDLLRQTNSTLESLAQALFKSWFIDFDPVRAKAEGLEPEGMDAATAALFPAEFEESALGLTPKGWRTGSVAELAALNAVSWTARRTPQEVLYVDLAGVKANVFEPPQRLLYADAPSRARRELRPGDTLVGTVRPGNRSFGFIADAEPGLTGSTGFAVLSPLVPNAAAFVYLCATRGENIERLAALADGGAYPAVRPELVHATACVLPPVDVLNAFHEVASQLLRGTAENTRRLRSLAEVRDTLLPRLISGKLRLPEAQALADEVPA